MNFQVQDTIPICASRISQIAAIGSLSQGRPWVYDKVATLIQGRDAIVKALSLLPKVMGGNGAMYLMANLPPGLDDVVSRIQLKLFMDVCIRSFFESKLFLLT